MLEAFRAMQAVRDDARLVMVGDGPERAALAACSSSNIVFAGMRTGDDLATHYASADVFLFPSTTETYGNVTIEAMASGLAVIAYDYAAAAEHIKFNDNGLVAVFDDACQFVALAAGLVNDTRPHPRSGLPRPSDCGADRLAMRARGIRRGTRSGDCSACGQWGSVQRTDGMKPAPSKVRSLFLSDIHLGSRACRADELLSFIKEYDPDNIFLIGDIVDFWAMGRNVFWPATHNTVVQKLLKLARHHVRVWLIPGNHDEALREYIGSAFGGINVVAEYVHMAADGKRYILLHGDEYDQVTTCHRWISILGDMVHAARAHQ